MQKSTIEASLFEAYRYSYAGVTAHLHWKNYAYDYSSYVMSLHLSKTYIIGGFACGTGTRKSYHGRGNPTGVVAPLYYSDLASCGHCLPVVSARL